VNRHRLGLAVALGVAVALSAAFLSIRGGGAPVDAARSTVVEVVTGIERGMSADELVRQGALISIPRPPSEIPTDVVIAPEDLAGLVAAVEIPAGTLVTNGMFVSPAAQASGLVGLLGDPGTTAIAVSLDATRAVGGWVSPGDRVNVLVPGQCADEGALIASASAEGEAPRCRRARYLLQAVRVLAVNELSEGTAPTTSTGQRSTATGPVTVVFDLPPVAAQWIASWENELWLTLVGPEYTPEPFPPLPASADPLPGERAP